MTTARMPDLGPAERRLLLNCARLHMDDVLKSETAALLHGTLAWDSILPHARLHSVASLLHEQLKQVDGHEQLPATVRRRLLQLYHATAYRNRLFMREHLRLLDAFDHGGIPVIVPKGLALLEPIYGSLALRPLIDLIFLVNAETAVAAKHIFLRHGYRQKMPRPLDGIYRWCCPQFLFETFTGMRVQVLVLCNLINWPRPHRLDPSVLWDGAQSASLGGRDTPVLSPVDLVLYLCVAADNHGYFNRAAVDAVPAVSLLFAPWSNNRLIRFTDIREVICRHRDVIDWDLFIERARSSGLDDVAHASLSLTNDLLGSVVSASIVHRLRAPRRQHLRRWLLQAVAPEAVNTPTSAFQAHVGSAWIRLRPYSQIRLARLIGLYEFALPDVRMLRLRYGIRSRAAVIPAYCLHAGRAVLRSIYTFGALSVFHVFDRLRSIAMRSWRTLFLRVTSR